MMKKKTSLTVWGFAAVASALLVSPSFSQTVDRGTPGNPPAAGTISLQGPAKVAASALPKVDAGAAKASLLEADRRLAGAAQESGTAALVPVLTDDVRLLRAGQAMTSGKAAA